MIDALTLDKLEAVLKYCLSNHLPFFAYRLPNSNLINIGVQKDLNSKSFQSFEDLKGKQGFVFAPFDSIGKHQSWFIREDLNFSSDKINNLDELSLYKNEVGSF
ncbi:MAG: isochorismate synthase, partial [Ancylomarina sp.]